MKKSNQVNFEHIKRQFKRASLILFCALVIKPIMAQTVTAISDSNEGLVISPYVELIDQTVPEVLQSELEIIDLLPKSNMNAETDIQNFDYSFPLIGMSAGGEVPENDNCSDVDPVELPVNSTLEFSGTTLGATPDTSFFDTIPVVWEAFEVVAYCNTITIEYCGSPQIFSSVFTSLYSTCPELGIESVASDTYSWDVCGDGNPDIVFNNLEPGTYYYPVLGEYGEAVSSGPYSFTVTTGGCIVPPPNANCEDVTPVLLTPGVPEVFTGNTEGAIPDVFYNNTIPVSRVWEAFEISEPCTDLKIEFCGNSQTYSLIYTDLTLTCELSGPSASNWNGDTCEDGNPTIWYENLFPGVYYYRIVGDAEGYVEPGDYSITVTATTDVTCDLPSNDNCGTETPIVIPYDASVELTGSSVGATVDTALSYFPYPVVYESIEITGECTDLKIEYCGTTPDINYVLNVLYPICGDESYIGSDSLNWDLCGEITNPTMWFYNLEPGVYHHAISGTSPGDYFLTLTASDCQFDCNGEDGGTAYIDECGDCVEGNTGATPCQQDCNGDWGGSAYLDNCGDCVEGSTGTTPCVADCNGDFGGSAYLDNCGDCVDGNTGEVACETDCNGDFGGTAFLDNCGDCVGGDTGETACVADCNGDFGGTAYLDNCGDCVEGNTGETACVADCNGDFGGSAFLDNCGDCVEGNTGEVACTADCNGDFGGTAFLDDCGDCVEGNTGEAACVADCNGDFGGTAFLDNCGDCVGGNTGETACVADCNGDFGGTAFLDNCGDCVEGNTGEVACEADCNGDFGGTAYLDDCDECVEGNTGEEPCELCDLELSGSAVAANPGTPDGSASVAVTGGTEPYEYAWNDPLFQATATATGLFSGSYIVTVTDANDCENQITVVVPVVSSVPNTQVAGMFCNTSGYNLGNFIAAYGVSEADAYRWEFTDSQNNTLPEYTRTDGNKWVRLEWITDIETGETYDVRVKARVSGTWGEYAAACSIGVSQIVPTTEVRPNFTPTNAQGNDYALCDFAIAYNVSGSENFRWRFDGNGTPGDAEDIIYTRGTGNPSVRLSWVNGIVPGLTYNVAVEVQVAGQWSGYSTVLPLTLALTPNDVEVRPQFCGGTYSPNGYIMSQSVCDADFYQFRFTPTGGGAPSFRNSGNYVCFMSAANPPLTPGDYDVQVKVTQNGVPGDWGPVCPITISGPQGQVNETPLLRDIEATGSATLFPNPNAGNEVRVNLDGLSDGNHEVMIQIYDIYGKLISTEGFGHEGKSLSRLVRFDGNLTTGMYMVQITVDGRRFATERLIVNQGNGF